jgi:hypothetical protein
VFSFEIKLRLLARGTSSWCETGYEIFHLKHDYHTFISVTFISKQCAFNVGLLEVQHNVFAVKKIARK